MSAIYIPPQGALGSLTAMFAGTSLTYTPTASATSGSPDDFNGLYEGPFQLGDFNFVEMGWIQTNGSVVAGTILRPQYSTDLGSNWAYMEASGTALAADISAQDTSTQHPHFSIVTPLATGAKARVGIRWVLYNTGSTPAQIAIRHLTLTFTR